MNKEAVTDSNNQLSESGLAARTGEPKGRLLIVGSFMGNALLDRYVSGDLAQRLALKGWQVSVTSRRVGRLARLLDMLQAAVRRRRDYDAALVDVFSGPAFRWAEAVCGLLRRLNKPFILTLHGGNLPAFAKRCPWRVELLLGSAAAVTTPSRHIQQALSCFRHDLQVIPNGLDLGRYQFRLRHKAAPELVWLRAFRDIYNPTLAPHVVAELVGDFPNVHLAMAGPDQGDGSLLDTQRLAARLGVPDRVSYPGAVPKDKVADWLTRGDIFLNTTNYESFGVSVMEAAASGLCIVSSRVGELPYLWADGTDCMLVPPNDAKAMASAVRRVLTDPALAESLSFNARAKAEQFDWTLILPRWERLLSQTAESSIVRNASALDSF